MPTFRPFKTEKLENALEQQYFGLWDAASGSLVLAKDDWLITYGNYAAEELLFKRLNRWVEIGMPSAASLDLKVYPTDAHVQTSDNQLLVKRRDSQFLWSLPT
jgi:hypothetical protein